MELKAGMYVRFSDGEIGKIAKYEFEKEFINGHCFWLERDPSTGLCCEKDEFKTSHNIIDLIQVGDYVNGYKVTHRTKSLLGFEDGQDGDWYLSNENIKSIVTKEQFKSVEFEVKK